MSPRAVREAFFTDNSEQSRFCLVTRPPAGVRVKGGIMLVPPFAEELNKSRRMLSLATQAFAKHGWTVLQLDLLGTGDSAGDFGDACWETWLSDLDLAWQLLQTQLNNDQPCLLWSLRAGSLLGADWLQQKPFQPAWLMWQPVSNGKQHLTQFLRLKAANEMLNDADARSAMARIRKQLAAGDAVEIAGYMISPELARGMDASLLSSPAGYASPVMALEVSASEQASTSPAITMTAEKWRAAGVQIEASAVTGPAFWQTQEIETAPALIASSMHFLDQVQT